MVGNESGQLAVLADPAGVGKPIVVSRFRVGIPELYFSVSMTTRVIQPGGVDGRDYFFVTPEKFQRHIDTGKMLEWAEIHGGLRRSGMLRGPVDKALAEGCPVLVEVGLAGVRSIRKVALDAHLLFLAPLSWEIFISRPAGCGAETEAQVKRYLETTRVEMDARYGFDEVVVNDNVDDVVAATIRAPTIGK